jgi:predicted  nucleic acid-binding Zn-ribbon protein
MTEHEDAAAGAERELADLEQRTEKLGEEIAEAREELIDAESDKPDAIEGAVGDHPERTDEPEADAPPQGWA